MKVENSRSSAGRFIRLTRFRKLFEQHSAIIVIFDAETGMIVNANKAAVSFYGWPLEKLTLMSFGEISLLPEDIKTDRRQDFLARPTAFFKHRLADGTIRDVEVFSSKFESSGKTFIYSIIQDITDRKLSEARFLAAHQELQRRNEQLETANIQLDNEERILSAVMEALPVGIAVKDKAGRVIHANKAFERIWNGSRPETRSTKDYSFHKVWWSDTNQPVAPEEFASAIAVKTGKVISGQTMRIEHDDGRQTFVMNSASPVFDKDGIILGSAIAVQDVTQSKVVEQALFESEQRLRLFIEHAPAAIAMFDRKMRYLSASLRWSKDNKLDGINLIGASHYAISTDLPERWKEAHRRGLAGEVLREEADLYERADGSHQWVRWEIRPWFAHSGGIGGIVIFTEDITERKQQEIQLQSLNQELEQRVEERTRELIETQHQYLHTEKLAAIGKLSASIAHEVNNPLQSVLTVLKSLRGNAGLAKEDLKFVELAIGEGDRIKGLIRSLQDFYRPSTRTKSMLDINSILDLLLLLQKSDFKSKRIVVECEYAKGLPMIWAVADQIKQVFLNLLTNAKESCLKGGTITITTRREKDMVAVAIRDTGIGIKPEQMDQIFRPFYSTKPAVKGTGLGLSISHGIVQSHGGEILVTSTPGEGATFTVLLPIEPVSGE